MKLVYGVGINDREKVSSSNGLIVKEYALWIAMLKRCYSKKFHEYKPNYIGCTISDEFKKYSYFYDWCNQQIGFNLPDYELDKDLLSGENKIYSQNTCCFLPKSLNLLITNLKSNKGELPSGVSLDKRYGTYLAKLRVDGRQIYIGTFKSELEAWVAYKNAKESEIKRQALRFKEQISESAFEKLFNYVVQSG